MNPEKWFNADKTRPFDQKVIGMGNIITNQTPLRPFHRDEKGTVWTPDDARDWFKLGYTYPELQRWTYGADPIDKLKQDVKQYSVSWEEALQMANPDNGLERLVEIGDRSVTVNDYAMSIEYSK